ncbi:hypothetical protein [Streptomyces sp. NPDC014734]|uniref:hypothetical protein n=1 Tax=Streptomyces sp. NPDC014734 TaxID=3364886 RepID=UPI0036FF4026
MNHPAEQSGERHSLSHDATHPAPGQHPQQLADFAAPADSAPVPGGVTLVVDGDRFRVTVTTAAGEGGTIAVGGGAEREDVHTRWTAKKVWGAFVTLTGVLGAIAGVIALFL